MPVPLDEELEPYTVRSKHSVFLGVLCALSAVAAAVCWFSTTVVYNRRAAAHLDSQDGPYEAFLDQEFVAWWNWAWVFVIAAIVLFVGAVLADAFNVHSSRMAYLLHHPIASPAEDGDPKPPDVAPADGDH